MSNTEYPRREQRLESALSDTLDFIDARIIQGRRINAQDRKDADDLIGSHRELLERSRGRPVDKDVTPEDVGKLLFDADLEPTGMSLQEVASELGCSKSMVVRRRDEYLENRKRSNR